MTSYVTERKAIPLIHLVMLNAVVCGLEFSASAIFTYVPPMLLKMGVSDMFMTGIMGLGPMVGLFAVPYIGKASDQCRHPFGRRRPFIVGISFGVIVSLLLIPNSELISSWFGGKYSHSLSVLLLCFGVVMLDFCSQAAFNPCEALLSDMCKGTASQDTGFVIYSFMLSTGGCIGYLITALDWTGSQLGALFGTQERSAFAVLITLFTLTLVATLSVAKDKPFTPKTCKRQHRKSILLTSAGSDENDDSQSSQDELLHSVPAGHESGYETNSNQGRLTPDNLELVSTGDYLLSKASEKNEMHVWRFCQRKKFPRLDRIRSRVCCSIVGSLLKSALCVICSPVSNFIGTPLVLKRLFVSHVLTWTAVMCHNMFYTEFVGHIVYGGDPNMPEGSYERELYDQGTCISCDLYTVKPAKTQHQRD